MLARPVTPSIEALLQFVQVALPQATGLSRQHADAVAGVMTHYLLARGSLDFRAPVPNDLTVENLQRFLATPHALNVGERLPRLQAVIADVGSLMSEKLPKDSWASRQTFDSFRRQPAMTPRRLLEVATATHAGDGETTAVAVHWAVRVWVAKTRPGGGRPAGPGGDVSPEHPIPVKHFLASLDRLPAPEGSRSLRTEYASAVRRVVVRFEESIDQFRPDPTHASLEGFVGWIAEQPGRGRVTQEQSHAWTAAALDYFPLIERACGSGADLRHVDPADIALCPPKNQRKAMPHPARNAMSAALRAFEADFPGLLGSRRPGPTAGDWHRHEREQESRSSVERPFGAHKPVSHLLAAMLDTWRPESWPLVPVEEIDLVDVATVWGAARGTRPDRSKERLRTSLDQFAQTADITLGLPLRSYAGVATQEPIL